VRNARKKINLSRAISPRRKQSAITVRPPEKPWELNDEQVVLLKNYLKIADASDLELKGCLEVARRYRLDPFKQGQIWFIKRWDKNAVAANGTKGAFIYTPQTGIYGLLHIAGRDYPDFGSMSEPEFGPMFMHEVENHKFKAPEWCRVKAFKKGIAEPTVATIYFEEFCPSVWDNARLFWAKMPRAQIEKCAKARALRTAYPDLGGLYIPEEMARFDDNQTPGGRQIIHAGQGHEMPALDMDAPHGHQKGTPQAAMAENALRRVEEADKALAEEKAKAAPKASPAQNAPTQPPIGAIELDLSVEPGYLRWDLANVLEMVKKHTKAYWDEKESWWRIPAADAATIREMCQTCGYKLTEIAPKVSGKKGKPESKRPAGGTEHPPAEPHVVKGTIDRSIAGMAGNIPVRDVTMSLENKKKPTFRTFDKALFKYLDAGVGKVSEVLVKQNGKYWNLVGLKSVGSTEFENGKTPVLSVHREPGSTKSLFNE